MTSIASGSVAEIVELAMRLDTRRGRTLDDLHDLAYRLDRSDPAEVESQLLRRAMLATPIRSLGPFLTSWAIMGGDKTVFSRKPSSHSWQSVNPTTPLLL